MTMPNTQGVRSCPRCAVELDEVYYASEAERAPGTLLPQGELKYACPDCDREWRRSADGPLVPFIS
jgi:hypothetical protein